MKQVAFKWLKDVFVTLLYQIIIVTTIVSSNQTSTHLYAMIHSLYTNPTLWLS